MEDNATDLECRVCRSGGEENRPLCHPCLCNGSIGLVHQDCLESWLAHSKKETCELCFTKYQFLPQYAENTPSVIPFTILLKSMLKIFTFKMLPFTLRVTTAFLMWMLVVPIGTTVVYCTCMRRKLNFSTMFSWDAIGTAVCYGFVIDAVMALSLLILMSFADFLRLHWIQAAANQAAQQQNQQQQQAQAANAPAIQGDGPAVPDNNAAAAQQHLPFRRGDINGGLRNRRRHGFRIGAAAPRDLQVHAENPRPAAPAPYRAPPVIPHHRSNDEEEEVKNDDLSLTVIPPAESKASAFESPIRLIPHTGSLDLHSTTTTARQNYRTFSLSAESKDTTSDEIDWNLVRSESKEGSLFPDSNVVNMPLNLSPTVTEDYKRSYDNEINEEDGDEHDSDDVSSTWSTEASEEGKLDAHIQAGPHQAAPQQQAQQGQAPPVAAPAPPVGAGNAAAAANNGDNDNDEGIDNNPFDNPDMQFNDENQVQIALLDVLGLEGPFFIIFRNAAWLMAFSSVYLTLLAFFPFVIGNIIVRFGRAKFDEFFPNYLEGFATKQLLNAVESISTEKNIPLQFVDFLLIAAGYLTIIAVIFCLDWLLSHVKSVKQLEGIETFASPVRQLATVVKVGVLLIMRIFLLPITLGAAILYLIAQQVMSMSLHDWASFLAVNAVGTYGLAWVAGITFMLSMTISVLQLREVLHPDIFGKLIKPQEAHNDLIASLVQESGLVHAKRIMLSFLVYSVLLQMIVGMPLLLFNYLSQNWKVFSSQFFHFSLWYKQPELQIPIELLVGHISFLSILDQRKDIIGHLQHAWLVMVSRHLGLTRFIIPVPVLGRKFASKKKRERGLRPRIRGAATAAASANAALDETDHNDSDQANHEQLQVGAPLARPPPGWDIRSSSYSSRWAWGTEEPSAVEKSVAPRVTPSYWLLRVFALVMLSWMLLIVIGLLIMVVPLAVGRWFCYLLHVPTFLLHDPLNFIFGIIILHFGYTMGKYTKDSRMLKVFLELVWNHFEVFRKVMMLASARITTHVLVGLLIHICTMREGMFEPATHDGMTEFIINGFHLWLSGCLIVETYTMIILSDIIGLRLQRVLGVDDFGVWFLESKMAVEEFLKVFNPTDTQQIPPPTLQQQQQAPAKIEGEALLAATDKLHKCIIGPMRSFSFILAAIYASAVVLNDVQYELFTPFGQKGLFTYFGVSVGVVIMTLFQIIFGWCYQPLIVLLNAAYTRIKDEHYLIGRKLQNAAAKHTSSSQQAPVAETAGSAAEVPAGQE